MNVKQGDEILYRRAVDQPFTLDQVATVDYVRATEDGLLVVAYLEDSDRDETAIFTDERLIARIGDPGEELAVGDAVVVESTVYEGRSSGWFGDHEDFSPEGRPLLGDVATVLSLQDGHDDGENNIVVRTEDGYSGYLLLPESVIRVADLEYVALDRQAEALDDELAEQCAQLAQDFTLSLYYPLLACEVAIPDEGIIGRVIHYDAELRVVTIRDENRNQVLRPVGSLRYRPEEAARQARTILGAAMLRMEDDLIELREGAK